MKIQQESRASVLSVTVPFTSISFIGKRADIWLHLLPRRLETIMFLGSCFGQGSPKELNWKNEYMCMYTYICIFMYIHIYSLYTYYVYTHKPVKGGFNSQVIVWVVQQQLSHEGEAENLEVVQSTILDVSAVSQSGSRVPEDSSIATDLQSVLGPWRSRF